MFVWGGLWGCDSRKKVLCHSSICVIQRGVVVAHSKGVWCFIQKESVGVGDSFRGARGFIQKSDVSEGSFKRE